MKTLFYSLLIVLISSLSVFGQNTTIKKNLEDTYTLPNSKRVEFNLKFAHRIDIKNWDKNKVLVKTLIETADSEFVEMHEVEVHETTEVLEINTFYNKKFIKKDGMNCFSCDDENEYSGDYKCVCFRVSHEIFLPKGAILDLQTINGDIEIREFAGTARIKTINGFVDMDWQKGKGTDLNMKTVNGEIYTDFDIKLNKGSNSYSKKLNTSLNGGGEALRLETINGDIFFRKKV